MIKKNFSKIIYILFISFLIVAPISAYELDLSVDEDIKKQYNTSKLEEDVLKGKKTSGKLSNSTINKTTTSAPKEKLNYGESQIAITPCDKFAGLKIPQWTHFKVKSNQQISDNNRKGTIITFTTTENVYKKYITIPSGTKFYGEIVNAHRPQASGNGGLVVIKITGMSYKGNTYQINGKITKANTKKIFFNNIKGKRKYIAGIGKQIDKGESFYKKTRRTSSKMADNPILVILSPIPTVVGVAGYVVNTAISPFTALTTKGGNLTIPSGSAFEIKLLDSAYVK